jgi:hypothetical protein
MGSGFETTRGLPLGQVLDGRIAEIFAGQQLLAAAPGFPGELFFWVSESSNSNAEVDYLVPISGQPVPVEVKSAAAGSLKSLHQFLWRAGLSTGVRLSTGLTADEQLTVRMPDGELTYRLLSLPIYLAEKLPALAPDLLSPPAEGESHAGADEQAGHSSRVGDRSDAGGARHRPPFLPDTEP